MSGETEQHPSAWTIDSLRTHFFDIINERDERYKQRFTDLETALRAALAASEKAIGKAEASTERRFDSVNEFRQTLSDQATTFMTRVEANALIARTTERIQDLTDRMNKSEGHGSGLHAGWVYLLGAVAAIGTIISIYLAMR